MLNSGDKIFSSGNQVLTETLVKKRLLWNFNPRSAPHHSGVWERVVRSFKHVFYAVLGNRRSTDEILTTFCFVQQNLNARPMVPVSSDATHLDALTRHFLLGTAGSVFRLISVPKYHQCATIASGTCVPLPILMLSGLDG